MARDLEVRVHFGVGTVRQVAAEVTRLGISRPLVVTDRGLAQTDIPGLVTSALDAGQITWTLFAEVEPNPSVETVLKGLEIYRREGCDGLVGVGGGSPIDAAKAIGLLAANGGDIRDYLIGNPEKHADIAEALGEDTEGLTLMEAARLAVDAVRDLSNDVGIPTGLREVGVTDAMLESLADDTMKATIVVGLNARRPTREEVLALFKQTMG